MTDQLPDTATVTCFEPLLSPDAVPHPNEANNSSKQQIEFKNNRPKNYSTITPIVTNEDTVANADATRSNCCQDGLGRLKTMKQGQRKHSSPSRRSCSSQQSQLSNQSISSRTPQHSVLTSLTNDGAISDHIGAGKDNVRNGNRMRLNSAGSTKSHANGNKKDASHRIIAKHKSGSELNPGAITKCVGRLLQKLRPYMTYVQKLYTVLLFNSIIITILLIISRSTENGLFGIKLLQSDSPPLLIAANVTMMISYSIQSYFILRICLSCGMFFLCVIHVSV